MSFTENAKEKNVNVTNSFRVTLITFIPRDAINLNIETDWKCQCLSCQEFNPRQGKTTFCFLFVAPFVLSQLYLSDKVTFKVFKWAHLFFFGCPLTVVSFIFLATRPKTGEFSLLGRYSVNIEHFSASQSQICDKQIDARVPEKLHSTLSH